MSEQCNHTRTYAVDTHDRIDCCDCDASWEGQEIVKMEQALKEAEEAIEKFGKFLENGEYLESELEKMKDANKHLQASLERIEAAEMKKHAVLWQVHCSHVIKAVCDLFPEDCNHNWSGEHGSKG